MIRAVGGLEQWVDRLRRQIAAEDSGVWVGASGVEIVGYGRAGMFHRPPKSPPTTAPGGYYLGGLQVAEPPRGRGLGRELTRARLAWIAERADTGWFVTNARNQTSLRLHRELGFREVTRDFVYPGVEFDGGAGVLCRIDLRAGGP